MIICFQTTNLRDISGEIRSSRQEQYKEDEEGLTKIKDIFHKVEALSENNDRTGNKRQKTMKVFGNYSLQRVSG